VLAAAEVERRDCLLVLLLVLLLSLNESLVYHEMVTLYYYIRRS
jgi:hypothetical protein